MRSNDTAEIGTPVVTLGFTQEELDSMAAAAAPDAIETWLHRLVSDALGSDAVTAPWPPHLCDDCSQPNPVWFAPSPLWNLVMGGPEATDDPGGIICPNCFIQRAEQAGQVPTAWMLTPERTALCEECGFLGGHHSLCSAQSDGDA